jgi:hypothetical protein
MGWEDSASPTSISSANMNPDKRGLGSPTQTKVVFIGSCFIGDDFKSLWNITDSTTDQALVVLANPRKDVILGHAVFEWKRLLHDMILQHMTVQAAVN